MAEQKKMTKKMYFEVLANIVEATDREDKADVLAFIAHEVELLNKKASKSSLTVTQKANIELKDTIREVLREAGKAMTIAELMADSRLAGLSNQKISANINRMADVVRTKEKKVSYFSLAE